MVPSKATSQPHLKLGPAPDVKHKVPPLTCGASVRSSLSISDLVLNEVIALIEGLEYRLRLLLFLRDFRTVTRSMTTAPTCNSLGRNLGLLSGVSKAETTCFSSQML